MLGIIIGVLWYVFAVLVGGGGVEVTVLTIANFLWYWYLVWGVLVALFPLCITLFGLVTTSVGTCARKRDALVGGAAVTLVGLIIGVLSCIRSGLFLVSTWLVYHAGDAATPIAEWNQSHLVAAGICALLGMLLSIGGGKSSGSSK